MKDKTLDRLRAVQRRENGETVESICRSTGYSRSWFYKWRDRASSGEDEWWADQSRRPKTVASPYDEDTEQLIVETRARLEREGSFCGAQAIGWELEDAGVNPRPSLSTIKRTLKKNHLIRTRSKRFAGKGKAYPAPQVEGPSSVHQMDFVGPRHIGAVRFYSLNAIDLSTGRCAMTPVSHRSTELVLPALWGIWTRLGMPKILQIDNELVFFGNQRYPHALGQIPRLCMTHDVDLLFTPTWEPWRNGVVEKFNDLWGEKFYGKTRCSDFDQLLCEARRFEAKHNARWRYSKLNGLTPDQALKGSGTHLRLPPSVHPPPLPVPAPRRGRMHFIRLVHGDGILEIFSEKFHLPAEAAHEYVRATLDVEQQCLTVTLAGRPIAKIDYRTF